MLNGWMNAEWMEHAGWMDAGWMDAEWVVLTFSKPASIPAPPNLHQSTLSLQCLSVHNKYGFVCTLAGDSHHLNIGPAQLKRFRTMHQCALELVTLDIRDARGLPQAVRGLCLRVLGVGEGARVCLCTRFPDLC
jgi:hypothetical protein